MALFIASEEGKLPLDELGANEKVTITDEVYLMVEEKMREFLFKRFDARLPMDAVSTVRRFLSFKKAPAPQSTNNTGDRTAI